jgi:hypothetical protein
MGTDIAALDPHPARTLEEYVRWCAENAVATQLVFDRAHAASILESPRLRISSFEIEAELGLTVQRTRQFEVRVRPLDLGYRVMRRDTSAADLRLLVAVEQVALPPMSHLAEAQKETHVTTG